MANQEAIDRGRRLHRLLENEDFHVLLKEWEERIKDLEDAIKAWDGTQLDHSITLKRSAYKRQALKSLREWIDDEIEIGGREKMKREIGNEISI